MWMPNALTIWMVGETQSNDFPVTPDALRPQNDIWDYDVFISCIGLPTTDIGRPRTMIPEKFALSVFPNPFNSTLSISLEIPLHQEITLTLYDLLGREVDVIYRARLTTNTLSYSPRAELASGVYLLRAATKTQSQIQKVALLI